MTFGLFNVTVALFVEKTVTAAKYNDILQKRMRLQDRDRLTSKMGDLCGHFLRVLDFDGELHELCVTSDSFDQLLADQAVVLTLEELDIAEEDRYDLFDILDADASGELMLDELLMGIAGLRGESRRSDIIAVDLKIRDLRRAFNDFASRATV